ncbi:hypothetical protein GCM10007968_26090 [Sporolactobacillus putidus]|uniref:Uncharacterized protein n=1 Tax=Sporolactobacillus putidus TaxID=492735 RepID=A0A917S663_9BACL|nr:hypothetical protein GCM10007968_26090 [Sporolactobacillus putidus]
MPVVIKSFRKWVRLRPTNSFFAARRLFVLPLTVGNAILIISKPPGLKPHSFTDGLNTSILSEESGKLMDDSAFLSHDFDREDFR